MKTEYSKFKKRDIMEDAYVTESIQIKITGKKEISKFVKDSYDRFDKHDYKAMNKIKIKGSDDSFTVDTEEFKFKDYKSMMREAKPKNIKNIQITLYQDLLNELEEDEVKVICKMLKKICEKYDAKIRRVLY